MTSLDWNPGYSVGNDVLDNQHKKLLLLCKEAVECMNDDSKLGQERFHLLLDELLKYAQEHFSAEEAILGSVNYPQLDEQKAEHYDYVEKLTEFLFNASMGRLEKAGVSGFMTDWWLNHILESDMQYKTFLQGRS